MSSLQGQLLVASPTLLDQNFLHTVILLVRHGEDGALGLVLNRPLNATIQTIWSRVSDSQCLVDGALYQGGPCDGPLMVVHDDLALSEGEVLPGIHYSTDKEAIEQLVADTARKSKFFVGYAGWTAGQLEAEMGEGSWMITPASKSDVFVDTDQLWHKLARRIHLTTAFPWLDPARVPDDPTVN